MANEIFFDRKHNVAIVKTEQSIEDFKQSTLDEFHKVQSQTRIVYLEDKLAKIKSGTIKIGDGLTEENLNELVKCYEDELKELKRWVLNKGEKMTKKANKKALICYISILLLIFCAFSLLFDIYMASGVVYGLISATIFDYILKKKLDKQ